MFKIAILFCQIMLINSAKILGMFPVPLVSHQNVYRPLMEALAKRGHEMTVVTSHPVDYSEEPFKFEQIDINEAYHNWSRMINPARWRENDGEKFTTIRTEMVESYMKTMEDVLSSEQVQSLIEDQTKKFDLCFIAALAFHVYPFKDRFDCSLILISSQSTMNSNFEAFGSPSNPIAYPSLFSPYMEDLDFGERIHAFSMYVGQILYNQFYYVPLVDASVKKHFGDGYRSVVDIEKSADMLFLNEHPVIGVVRPVTSNILFLYGLHLKPNKELPEDLKKILDDAENGVIYLSLGSNVKSNQLSQYKIGAFLEAFKALPYTVIWKWENKTLPGKPDNVFISKWLPQQDILAHPKVKVFITQGGQQSMEEAIHYKVPLIGIPFFGDQDLNVRKFIKFGIGTYLNLHTLTKENIMDAVNTILTNSSYRENIEKLSNLLEDQPQTSLERAVWWTEYVLRHKGAQHLKSPATKIPLYQYFLLDVMLFFVVCFVGLFLVVSTLTRCCCKLCRKPGQNRQEVKLKTS